MDRLAREAREGAGVHIGTWDALLAALEKRHAFFHERGCRASDHGLEVIDADPFTDETAASLFHRLRAGRALDAGEARVFRSALRHRLALLDHARGWVQQYHVGAMRNNNARMKKHLGPDTGFDSIGDFQQGRGVARFLDRLDETDQLAKTILYNLNPADNELMATMIGNFQDGSVPGKMHIAPQQSAYGPFRSVDDFFFWALDDRRLPLSAIIQYLEKTLTMHKR